MAFTKFNILINDTTLIAGNNIAEKTARANPHLVYNGSDDEFQPIMASELSFNMLVPDASDGKFLHLFTGNETRFEVQLEDAITSDIIWQGFLMPDLYSEPYENGSLFVKFTATDGLGRLKNKYLADEYYKETKNILDVIEACLRLTGNAFTITVAPAIKNAAVDFYENDKEIDTSNFIDNNKQQNAYEILEDLLVSLGSRLFVWRNQWYIVGINRFNDITVDAEFYGANGARYVADGITTFTRTVKSIAFESTPLITALPPFKDVIINWKKDQPTNVFPIDIIYQKDANVVYNKNSISDLIFDVDYWQQTGTSFYNALYFKGIKEEEAETETTGPFYLQLGQSIGLTDVGTRYIDLIAPVYIVGAIDKNYSIDFKLNATIWCTATDPTALVDSGAYAQKLLYNLTKDGTTILSNKATFDLEAEYDFEFSVGAMVTFEGVNYYPINAKLNYEEILIIESGYINLQLHPILEVATGPFVGRVAYTQLEVTYNGIKEDGYFKKTRSIDYTTSEEVNLNYGFDNNDLTTNVLKISPFVNFVSYTYNIAPEEIAIPIIQYERILVNNDVFTNLVETIIHISKSDYFLMTANNDSIYVKRAATGILELVTQFYLSPTETDYVLIQWGVPNQIELGDELFVKINAEVITETDRRFMLTNWKRVGENERITYSDALARIYHGTTRDTKFKIEGNVFGIVTPLDILQFNYLQAKNYNITSLDIDLSEGETSVVLIESKKDNMADYE